MSHYDLVVDASDMTPEQVADAIEVWLYAYTTQHNDD
jgi:cytidylate kinase